MTEWRAALAALCGEATAADEAAVRAGVSQIEVMLGVELPTACVAFLLRAPQCGRRVFGDFNVLSVDRILAVLRSVAGARQDGVDDIDAELAGDTDDRIRRVLWEAGRVPVADVNGDLWLCLDFSPAAGGIVGQVILMDPEALSWR